MTVHGWLARCCCAYMNCIFPRRGWHDRLMWHYAISALSLQFPCKVQVELHQATHCLSFQLPLSLSNITYLNISKLFLRFVGLHKSRSKCIWHPHINNVLSLFTAAVVPEMMIYQWFSWYGFVSLIVAMWLQCTTPWPASSFPNTTGCYKRLTSVLFLSQ